MNKSFRLLTLVSAVTLSACASHSVSQSLKQSPTATNSSGSLGWQIENTQLSEDKQQFIAQVAQRYQIPSAYIQKTLAQATYNQQAVNLMSPKQTRKIKKHWETYRNRFVEPIRIRRGTAFWNTYRQELTQAEQQYGVPAAIIAGIIGVETLYGSNMGSFNLRDALYSLGFYYPDASRPDKAQIFRNQLAALIYLDYTGKLNASTATGSFAGAYGMGQFMPVSILHYAVDADHDGKIRLDSSVKDAIASVANFLVQHGWQPHMPVFAPASLPNSPASLVDGGLDPTLSWTQLKAHGATSASQHANWQQGKVLGVIDLRDDVSGQHQYRTATQNFFVITKYNRSYFYATAVTDLATELALQQKALGHQVTMP